MLPSEKIFVHLLQSIVSKKRFFNWMACIGMSLENKLGALEIKNNDECRSVKSLLTRECYDPWRRTIGSIRRQ